MSVRNLEPMFRPASIAVIGASRRPRTVGQVVVRNLIEGGFSGPIWPVNPKADDIAGLRAFPDLAALPAAPDLAVLCTPAPVIPDLIAELGRRGTKAAIVISAGFAEAGEEGRAREAAMLKAARPHLLRILGPNCVGAIAPRAAMNASFAHRAAPTGDIAFLSQSGAVITAVLDWAAERGVGFSLIASLGGMADVDFGDLLDFLARDPETRAILLYVEQVTNAAKFMSAARAASRLKPVVVIKPGRSAAAAQAAFSHTGALAGADAVYDAAFRRAGMLRVRTLSDVFDAVETLARPLPYRGERLAILTNGGGVGVLAVDSLADVGGRLAQLAPATVERLNAALPATWSKRNPVDIIGDADGARYAAAYEALEADPGVDAVLALNCPTAIADGVEAARALLGVKRTKPLLTSWLGEGAAREARELFEAAGAPTYDTPSRAVAAFQMLVEHQRNQEQLLHAPPPSAFVEPKGRAAARALVAEALKAGRDRLGELEAKRLLEAYGIPVVPGRLARDPKEAAAAAAALGFPAAVKIVSPDIVHKSDADGVALNLTDAAAVRRAAEAMLRKIKERLPSAQIEGFAVQPMAIRPGAHELILGLVEDAAFGPVILFGHGGTAVEVVRDQAIALPPLNRILVDELMARTRIHRLLEGYRDRPRADLDAVAHALMRLGEMAADIPEIVELDINPLWADAEGVLALDARVRIRPCARAPEDRLAIRPYPRDLETNLSDAQGARYALRPIRPDDMALLKAFVLACDPEDIRMRFLTALRALPDPLAARLSQIDYRREMAFLAFAEEDGRLAGVARLAADPDNERAEFAAIVRSDLKGRGLGTRLVAHVLDYARACGVAEVFGDTLADNARMLALSQDLGFEVRTHASDPSLVEMVKRLRG